MMRRKFTFKFMFLLCALVVGSSSVWADDTYTRITSTTDLKVGEKYIIVSENKNIAMGTISGKHGQGVSVTISNHSIILTSSSNVNVFTLGGDADGYTLLGSKDDKYIGYYGSSADLQANNSAADNKYKWTIDFTSSNNANITNVSATTRLIRCYDSNSDFRAYTTTNGSVVQLYKLVYIITPAVNDVTMGSATISGNTITAAPNAGYRVKSGDEGYTVTEGTATVVNNGNNTFTVTPTSNCTVQINFEALPSHTLNTVVTPNAAGTVTLGSTSVIEGTTTTATAVANAGFKFVNWSIEGTGASLSSNTDNPTTVTMGSSDATITANFTTATTFAISYSVNGKIVEIKNVEENTPIDLSAPTSGVPSGFVFQGWVNEPFTGTQSTAPTYVTPTNATSNVTYYAVMAMLLEEDDDTYEKLGNQSFDANATYVIGAEQASTNNTMWYLYSYSKVDENAGWGVMTSSPASNAPITFTLSGTANALVAKDDAGNYLKGVTSNFQMSSTSTTVAINESGAIQNASSTTYKLRHNYNSGNGGLRWYNSSTGTQAYFYKVIPGNVYGNFCTTVTNTFTADGNWNDATKWSLGIVPAEGYAVTIDAACVIPASCIAQAATITIVNEGSLTIADGGQLIHNNAVEATLQKNITKASNWGAQNPESPYVPDGWYFIASPVVDASVDVATIGTYDLFYYNEAAGQWYNQKKPNGFTNFTEGWGYLYATNNTDGQTLSFAGSMKATNATVTVPMSFEGPDVNIRGFNLAGNPFTRNLVSGEVELNGQAITTYYTIEGGTNLVSTAIDTDPIKPGQGFLVQANGEEQNLVFNPTTTRGGKAEEPAFISIEAGNDSFMDRAYVQIGGGNTLRKMTLNDNTAKVYVMNDGKDYAAATIEAAQGEMPVNFKAAENGYYTITVNAKGVETNYLHLIDNMTGANIDLLQTPSYSFEAKTSDFESRFRLVFASNGASTGSASEETFAFISNGNIIVNGEGTLQVIDVTGRLLLTREVNSSLNTPHSSLTPGVYVMRLINGDNVRTQKIVIE